MSCQIILKNISKSYNGIKIINNLSLEARAGEALVIWGPSGCGKTTLLRLVAGLETLDEGEIYINGVLASSAEYVIEPYRRQIGFVFQAHALWPHMTIKQNIIFGIRGASKNEAQKTAADLMEKMDIIKLADHLTGEVSGGQAKRTAIARALAAKPEILLMDEPLVNLEKDLKFSILDLVLQYMRENSACLLYVTHDDREAEYIGGTVLRMKGEGIE